jgi:hypothetical protein
MEAAQRRLQSPDWAIIHPLADVIGIATVSSNGHWNDQAKQQVWPWARSDQWPLEWSGQATGVAMNQVRPMAIGMIGPSNRCGHEPGPTNGHYLMFMAIGMTRPLSEQQVALSQVWAMAIFLM